MSEKKERDRRREEALTEKKIREECDRLSKLVLSSPAVLSLFLPHTCWEFEGLTSEEVQKRIIRHPQGTRAVDAEAAVVFEKTEVLEDQAKTTFDMLFEAEAPGSVMLRINVEVQGKYLSDPVMKGRMVYYTVRLISTQKAEEFFTGSHYDKLRKVYSIWICLNPPAKRRGCLVRHRFMTEVFYPGGHYELKEPDQGIDKMGIVEICLAKDPEKQEGWMQALQVLLDEESTPQERRRVLEENHVKFTDQEDEEVMKMFSYSDYLEERVRAKTMAEAAVDKQKAIAEASAEKQKALAERDTTIASKLLNLGVSIETIHESTGLPIAAINSLKAKLAQAVPYSGMMTPA